MILAILCGVIAMFAGGISNALLKSVTLGVGAVPTVLLRAGVSALCLYGAYFILQPQVVFQLENFIIALLISILGYFPFLFYVKALGMEKVGVVAPIASSWIVVAAGIGFLFFGDVLTSEKLFVLCAVVLGVVLTSIDFKAWGRGHAVISKQAIVYSVLAAALWGVVFPLFKVPSEFFGVLFFGMIIETVVFLSAAIHLFITKTSMPSAAHIFPHAPSILAAGVLTAVFTPAVSFGFLTGNVSIVSALAGASTVVAVFTASYLYKERLTVLQYSGAVLILLGTVFASIL